jgi:phosphoribosylamine--glycine ligase
MNVLVIGGGGREHALAWKLAQSPKVQMVYVAPGNGGTALDSRLKNLPITDVVALRAWAQENKIGLTVVGPEGPLAAGVVDEFRAHGLRIFGPTKAAAQLESSKAFSKAFMQRHGIPTAEYATFSDPGGPRLCEPHGCAHRGQGRWPGRGQGRGGGHDAGRSPCRHRLHAGGQHAGRGPQRGRGRPGRARVVIEEFLEGEEASFMVVCDGKDVVALATSQDHKRLLDDDQGPNTGGMGAYSPAPVVTPQVHARAMREIILPTLKGMEQDGIPYTGFLYAGLMIDPQGQVKTLEFNCRMGDPETQPILMRLKTDLVDVLMAATEPGVAGPAMELEWDRRTALGVVLAAAGYPWTRAKGMRSGLARRQPDEVHGVPCRHRHA